MLCLLHHHHHIPSSPHQQPTLPYLDPARLARSTTARRPHAIDIVAPTRRRTAEAAERRVARARRVGDPRGADAAVKDGGGTGPGDGNYEQE